MTRNLTGIVSVKKASIKKKETVDLSEDQAAVMIQKGRGDGDKEREASEKQNLIFDEPSSCHFHSCISFHSLAVLFPFFQSCLIERSLLYEN